MFVQLRPEFGSEELDFPTLCREGLRKHIHESTVVRQTRLTCRRIVDIYDVRLFSLNGFGENATDLQSRNPFSF